MSGSSEPATLPASNGQSRVADNQKATPLRAPRTVGVYGVGDAAGVEGDNDRVDPNGSAVGTGVVGRSVQGAGVVGRGLGDSCLTPQVEPYIGVCGISQATPTFPYPTNNQYLGTGIFGGGDVRGGVFQATPPAGAEAETFANVQLTPLRLATQDIRTHSPPPPSPLPRLSKRGRKGDILAVDAQTTDGQFVQLWVCIREATAREGAMWAKIRFDVFVTPPL